MKNKIVAVIAAILIVLTFAGCESKGVNILEQPEDYVGEFNVPSSKKVEEGSALSVLASINENTFEVESAIKTKSDDPEVLESYRITCYGINIELFRYADDAAKLKEVQETGKFTVESSSGKVIGEFDAIANGHYVMMFASSTNSSGEDQSENNQKVVESFKALTLE